jgi:hypothetical protein
LGAFFDEPSLKSEFKALIERYSRLPNPIQGAPFDFNTGEGASLLSSTTCSIFGYIWNRNSKDEFFDIVHLARQMRARVPLVEVHSFGADNLNPEWLPSDCRPAIRLADSEEPAMRILASLGESLVAWASGGPDSLWQPALVNAGRKMRGLYDRRTGTYFSQKAWPFAQDID